jgi:CHAD domain-containing protein
MAGLLLSNDERRLLEEYCSNVSGVLQRRSHLILLYDEGLITHQAAEQAGLSRSQARFWKHQYLSNGLTIFPGLPTVHETELDTGYITDVPTPVEHSDVFSPGEEISLPDELPFPAAMKRPGILPTDTLAEAGRKTWLYQFAEMIQKEEPTRLGVDIEGLHDMRVATRRMRSAFDVFGNAFKPKILKKHLTGLRTTGRALGSVRDMDVLIEKLTDYMDALQEIQREGLMPLLYSWRMERELGRQALITFLDSPKYLKFKTEFNRFVQTPGDGVRNISQISPQANLVCEIVPALIYTRMGAVRAFDSILQNASDTQLHALRIEFKKLRYAVEYFREVLGAEATNIIQDLKLMQDHLGNLHDAVVACDLVTEFLKDWEKSQLDRPLAERQNPEPIVTYLAHLHAERHRLLVTLPEAWVLFNRPEFRANLAKAIAVL